MLAIGTGPASRKGEVRVDAGGTKADIPNVAASPKAAGQEKGDSPTGRE
ncbi:hypothetical protein C900_01290 [Fulvivirga imtechensis AK7]|uniref:Uncharacterized protein n=1 Tax=Fulvivirga imtechensis AK7 TaxID=1237149 RepID=L8JKF7_9BACT|nr:hypothetical protein [Fulvivirga imtechensis]ELR67994.1 hypothetical protein C900_01290 [Fulvivirga imtechensis AK7]